MKAVFSAWLIALGKILTLDYLKNCITYQKKKKKKKEDNLKNWHVIVMVKCSMCKRNGEFMDHLFLHFDAAYAIWIAFFNHFGLSWVMSRSVVNMYACWWAFVSLQSAVEDGAYVLFMVFMEGNESHNF